MRRLYTIFFLLLSFAMPVMAQDEVPVPDLTGLGVPQAAAVLNILGLNLGSETAIDPEPGQATNTIVGQSQPPGTSVARGTAIGVSVVLPPNMRLIYDDNDITVQNLTEGNMNLGGVVFRSAGDGAVSFNPDQVAGIIDPDDCVQIWSITRNQPKDVAGCDSYLWRSTTNTGVHFWTQLNGIQSFTVVDNGIERGVCQAAPAGSQDSPLICDVYVSGAGNAGGGDTAPFIYLAYTSDAIAFINPTQDQWMVTNQTTLVNNNPNSSVSSATLIFGDTALLREEHRISAGDITRLAPQQCIMYTANDATVSATPEPCLVIAQRPLDGNTAFWRADFLIRSSTGENEVTCPGAISDELIICIAPR